MKKPTSKRPLKEAEEVVKGDDKDVINAKAEALSTLRITAESCRLRSGEAGGVPVQAAEASRMSDVWMQSSTEVKTTRSNIIVSVQTSGNA